MIRVLVAEDSTTARQLLVDILRSDDGVEIAGEAANGAEAVAMTAQLRPDVITMDIRMPKMDGFEATRHIMVESPTPIVIVSASYNVREVEVSMNALRAGALTVLPKPPGPSASDFQEEAQHFVDTVKSMSQVKVVRRWPDRTPPVTPARGIPLHQKNGVPPSIVAIAASTGGPAALAKILAELPPEFPLPILIVQHIARGFVEGFASWLNTTGTLRVKVGVDGESLARRTVYLAPDDHHVGVRAGAVLSISGSPPIEGFRPSATYLYETVAREFGRAAVAVILTGMGHDGVAGLRAVRSAGGRIIAQDEATSVVFGMPAAAIAEGLADATLPLGAVPLMLREMVS